MRAPTGLKWVRKWLLCLYTEVWYDRGTRWQTARPGQPAPAPIEPPGADDEQAKKKKDKKKGALVASFVIPARAEDTIRISPRAGALTAAYVVKEDGSTSELARDEQGDWVLPAASGAAGLLLGGGGGYVAALLTGRGSDAPAPGTPREVPFTATEQRGWQPQLTVARRLAAGEQLDDTRVLLHSPATGQVLQGEPVAVVQGSDGARSAHYLLPAVEDPQLLADPDKRLVFERVHRDPQTGAPSAQTLESAPVRTPAATALMLGKPEAEPAEPNPVLLTLAEARPGDAIILERVQVANGTFQPAEGFVAAGPARWRGTVPAGGAPVQVGSVVGAQGVVTIRMDVTVSSGETLEPLASAPDTPSLEQRQAALERAAERLGGR